ncbi:SRPBCC family protein [Pseudohongiella sp.]|uniref:Activator of Hsp90 ATPase homologue 1/2-like C-terminal domain-containing protein n=1 Tax=marine sediment metagenome TaxID=412755 RepID=A0A0F9YJY1_9ZZZZ|nr:SRPBCC family protein [Pseudohongiella sp.]HDZ07712.1 vanillate O-demethylase oxidoreductase VanB [Pseudohongiella sp.]HEA63292.1 vanillate O-demethylase oxidoreductase VanB [Pseudohongiella sp.]
MDTQDSIVKVVDIQAPVSRVWQALTDYRQFGEWFCVDLNEPFSPGSRSTGLTTYPGYEGHPWLAEIESMEPQTLFSFRWNHEDAENSLPLEQQPTTKVEFRLEDLGEATRLTISETGFSALPESQRAEAIRLNTQGWDIQAQQITDYVVTRRG